MVAANAGAKKPEALLDDDSDTFLKNDCRGDKWLMLELSQVVKVSGVELAQVRSGFGVGERGAAPRTLVWAGAARLACSPSAQPSTPPRPPPSWPPAPCACVQYELYSSRVKQFELYGRRSHPRTDGVAGDYARSLNSTLWHLMGNFTAETGKGAQARGVGGGGGGGLGGERGWCGGGG